MDTEQYELKSRVYAGLIIYKDGVLDARCSLCHKLFKNKYYLIQHFKSKHIDVLKFLSPNPENEI